MEAPPLQEVRVHTSQSASTATSQFASTAAPQPAEAPSSASSCADHVGELELRRQLADARAQLQVGGARGKPDPTRLLTLPQRTLQSRPVTSITRALPSPPSHDFVACRLRQPARKSCPGPISPTRTQLVIEVLSLARPRETEKRTPGVRCGWTPDAR
jgi:hypothetical protein